MNVKLVNSGGLLYGKTHTSAWKKKKKKTASLQINKQNGNLAIHLKSRARAHTHTHTHTHTLLTQQPISSTRKHHRDTLTVHQSLHIKSIHLEEADTYNIP